MPCTVVPAAVAIDRWPSLVFDFLVKHVHVVKEPSAPVVTFEVKESEDTIGDPIRLICECCYFIYNLKIFNLL